MHCAKLDLFFAYKNKARLTEEDAKAFGLNSEEFDAFVDSDDSDSDDDDDVDEGTDDDDLDPERVLFGNDPADDDEDDDATLDALLLSDVGGGGLDGLVGDPLEEAETVDALEDDGGMLADIERDLHADRVFQADRVLRPDYDDDPAYDGGGLNGEEGIKLFLEEAARSEVLNASASCTTVELRYMYLGKLLVTRCLHNRLCFL